MAERESMDYDVVIVGGGFGGVRAARALGELPVDVVLLDRTNHHLFPVPWREEY